MRTAAISNLPRYRLLAFPLLACLCFGLGLTGGFQFDDYANILNDPVVAIDELTLDKVAGVWTQGRAGPTGRPISLMSFAINHALAGAKPFSYKLTNLAIHIVCAFIVFFLVRAITRTPRFIESSALPAARGEYIAFWVALLWTIAPINLTPALYVVQRMTSLSGLFVMLGLLSYLHWRPQAGTAIGLSKLLASVGLCLSLGVLCKEGAAALPFMCAVCELCLFRTCKAPVPEAKIFDSFIVVCVVLPLLGVAALVAFDPHWLVRQYEFREFGIADRLLTESRILWSYVFTTIFPYLPSMGLFRDDIEISRSLLSPASTLLAVVGWVVIVVLARVRSGSLFPLGFCLAWFLAAHGIESTFLGLELYFEHRNYVASIGPLLLIVCLIERMRGREQLQRFASMVLLGWCLLFALTTTLRSEHWSDPVTHALSELQYHPESYRARYQAGWIYYGLYTRDRNPQLMAEAKRQFEIAGQLDRESTIPYFSLVQSDYELGREPDPNQLEQLRLRLSQGAPHPNFIEGLKSLNDCTISGRCQSDPQVMFSLYGAVLSNPDVDQALLPDVAWLLSDYYLLVGQDIVGAMTTLDQAIKMAPQRLEFALKRIKLLLMQGACQDAAVELQTTRKQIGESAHWTQRERLGKDASWLDEQLQIIKGKGDCR